MTTDGFGLRSCFNGFVAGFVLGEKNAGSGGDDFLFLFTSFQQGCPFYTHRLGLQRDAF